MAILMNNTRRKKLLKLVEQLQENIYPMLEELKDEEDEALNNMPESLQGTERYEIAENALDALESALDSLEESIDYILTAAE